MVQMVFLEVKEALSAVKDKEMNLLKEYTMNGNTEYPNSLKMF